MATYQQLKALAENPDKIKNRELINSVDIDGFDKVPKTVRESHDEFVAANSDIPGVLDYDKLGYTEPEDYRHCFQNNQALSRIDELMPYIDKMNIPQADVNDSHYSSRILPIGDEILKAKDDGLSEDKLDYLCESIVQRDLDAPHWERETTVARKYLENFEVNDVQKFMEGPSDNRQSVSFYIESFYDAYMESWRTENPEVKDEMMKGVAVIQKANDSSEAFGLYQAMSWEGIKPEVADKIHESCNMMISAPKDKNPDVGGDDLRMLRFDDNHSLGRTEGYVQSITELVKEHKSVFEQNPELICDMTKDFIDNGGTQSYISQYYHGEPDKLHDYVAPYYTADVEKSPVEKSKAQPCGSIDNTRNHYMFYTGGGGSYTNNTSDEIAKFGKEHFDSMKDMSLDEIKDKHIYWGSDEAVGYGLKGLYNGDTYVLFDDLEKLPKDMQHDAMKMCAGLEEPKQQNLQPQAEAEKATNAELSVKNISERTITNKDGKESTFYTGYVDVPKSVSQNGRAYITFNANQVADINVKDHDFANGDLKSATVCISTGNSRGARIMNNSGKYETKQTTGSELKKWSDEVSAERSKQIASTANKGSQIDGKNVEDQKGLIK